jgi:hypothetical protein
MNHNYRPVTTSSIPLHTLSPTQKFRFPLIPKKKWASFEAKRRWFELVHDWWAWEYLASVVSVAATAGLIVTLAVMDGKKVPSWGIAGAKITLNAIVAAISTVIRTGLMIVVGGAMSQNAWNWYASQRAGEAPNTGKPLKDLDAFADAGTDPFAGLKLIWRTKGRYGIFPMAVQDAI